MAKRARWSVVVVFLAVLGAGAAALLVPRPVSAASGCWQVDCNVCCKTGKGPVVCTQRACV
jgi:hypothetical protein